MASAPLATIAEVASALSSSGAPNQGDDSKNPQPAETGPEAPKPARAPPKVFASPKKKHGKGRGGDAGGKQSLRSKLRKALAPYMTASYLKGEMVRRFTEDFMNSNPPPADQADLPTYMQHHLRELNRVTERWTGTVGHALDPLAHEMAVDRRLQRLRDREEGRLVESTSVELPGKKQKQQVEEEDVDAGIDYMALAGGLTNSQIFGAVHMVSDVKVWEQILAAQKAEERRQHAIAELHMNHAAKIIQRSWHTFITQKKEEQARLDALVSPDVQAMLSAAAYKAMRDARNKLAIMKLRKSLSRRARGFGSGMPRDLDPIPRPSYSRKNLNLAQTLPPRTAGRPDDDRPDSRARSPTRDGPDGSGDGFNRPVSRAAQLGKVKSFAARSAQVVQRLVSMKDLAGGGGAGGGRAGRKKAPVAQRQRPRRQKGEDEDEEDEEDEDEEGSEESEDEDEEDDEDGDEEEDGEDGEGEEDGSLVSGEDDGEGGEEGDEDDAEVSAEAAMAEAEEVVEMAAELAKAILGVDEDDESDGGEGEGAEGAEGQGYSAAKHMDDAALAALAAVEAAAEAAAGGHSGGVRVVGNRVLAPMPPPATSDELSLAGTAALRAPPGAAGKRRASRPGAPAAAGAAPRIRGMHLTGDSALIRQLIAGALAAAAAPVLGRKKALAVAQLGLGDLLVGQEGPQRQGGGKAAAGGPAARAAAAGAAGVKLRPAPGRKTLEETLATGRLRGGGPLPLEIRAAAAALAGLGSPGAGGSPPGLASPGLRRRGSEGGSHYGGERVSQSGVLSKAAWRSSVSGDLSAVATGVGGGGSAGRQPPRASNTGGPGSVTLPVVAGATGGNGSGGGNQSAGSDPRDRADSGAETADPHLQPAGSSGRPSLAGTGSGPGGVGLDAAVAASFLPSPRSPNTTISAAAAAAAATQPWASPRRHGHGHAHPGAHTIGGSLPDPRGGFGGAGAAGASGPREPTWLLPPINRSSTGPVGLGGVGLGISQGGAALAAALAAGAGSSGGGSAGHLSASASSATSPHPPAAAQHMIRTSSDSNLQPPFLASLAQQQQQDGVGGMQATSPGLSRLSMIQSGPMGTAAVAALAAGQQRGVAAGGALAAAAGRTRRASVVGSSVDAMLQQHLAHLAAVGMLPGPGTGTGSGLGASPSAADSSSSAQRCGFVINSMQGGSTAQVTKVRLGADPNGQPPPLPSALVGGGGGAGGGTAAARQVVQHMTIVARAGS